MAVEATLHHLLASDPRLSAILGTRIFPGFILEGRDNFPAATYTRESTNRIYDARGATGQVEATFTLSLFSDVEQTTPHAKSWEMFDLARDLFDSFNKTPFERRISVGGAKERIKRIFVQNERDVLFTPIAGEGVIAFGVSCELDIAYAETIPHG